jgi:hypothetical protein
VSAAPKLEIHDPTFEVKSWIPNLGADTKQLLHLLIMFVFKIQQPKDGQKTTFAPRIIMFVFETQQTNDRRTGSLMVIMKKERDEETAFG